MNDSISTISPAWPTRWPKDSFKSPWTWVLAAIIAAIFVSGFVLGLKNGNNASMKGLSPLIIDVSLVLTMCIEGVPMLVVLLALPSLSKFTLRELGFRVPTGTVVATAVLGSIAMAIVADGGASLIGYLAHSQHQQDVIAVFESLHDKTTIAIFSIFAIVVAPVIEETLFRVFFFNLGLRYGGFWTGAIVSGVLFGVAHGDLFALVPLAAGGMILCYVYYRTRNAFASMISHALFNSFSIAALLFFPQVSK